MERRRLLACASVMVLSGLLVPAADPTPVAAVGPFQGLIPARLVDTRSGASTVDGKAAGQGSVDARQPLTFPVAGRGGVPAAGVGAVALNVTAISPTAASFLTVYPAGATRPNASNLNLAPGRTIPNMVIVPLGAGGALTVHNDRGSTHVAVDVLGWFPAGGGFTGLSPARLTDSRPSGTTVDGQSTGQAPVGPGGTRTFPVLGRGGVPGSGVGAVALNVTAVSPTAASFLTVYPAGAPRPNASNLNLAPGRTLPNMVVVPVGTGGAVTVYNDQGSAHVAVDVLGWFPAGGGFTGLTPARLTDTRPSGVTIDGASLRQGALGPGQTVDVPVLGRGGVPKSGVGAVALNVTAINPGAASFVTAFPRGASRPLASNLNLAQGRTLPNMVIVPVGVNGEVSFYNDRCDTHLAIDVLGWFPGSGSTSFTAPPPRHLVPVGPSTSRVSLSSACAQGVESVLTSITGGGAALSGDGRFVAFASLADNLVTGDTNGHWDVFVHDRQLRTTARVSVASGGAQANGNSIHADISADGRYVAFESWASNLAPFDNDDVPDIFLHDRETGVTTRVSVTSSGLPASGTPGSRSPRISADGRFVMFTSGAALSPGNSRAFYDVYVHDRLTAQTSRVSVGSGGSVVSQEGASSWGGGISGDGRFVTFSSDASTLVPGDTNGVLDVFVHDRLTRTTSRVSVGSDGTQAAGGHSWATDISNNGRFVVFESRAVNLDHSAFDGESYVYVYDTLVSQLRLVSTGPFNPTGSAFGGRIAGGEHAFVTFVFEGQGLVPGDKEGRADILVSGSSGGFELVSASTSGIPGDGTSSGPAISDDGRVVAFESEASNLVSGDTNGSVDIFVRDRGSGPF